MDSPSPGPSQNRADPFAAIADLRSRRVPFVLATVVRAVAPTSAKPGDKALITRSGLVSGWIGGSCAEPIVRKESEAALRDGECRLLCIAPDGEAAAGREGLSVHKMECYSGGALEIYLEPYLPPPTLLVFGTSPVARALADVGRVMRYRVVVVDLAPRRAGGGEEDEGDQRDVVRDLARLPPLDRASTYAVVATHGVFDEEGLESVAALDPAYAGFVTSRKRRDEVFAVLSARGTAAERIAHITAPAGLDLGARLPEEIALSVMAQIVAVRRAPRPPIAEAVAAPAVAPVARVHLQAKPAEVSEAKSCCHGKSPIDAG